MMFWMAVTWQYALFAWSAEFIDISIAAVLFEAWPLLMVALINWLFRNECRYRQTGPVVYFAFALAIGGVAVVILSKSGALEFKTSLRVNLYTKEFDQRIQFAVLKTLAVYMNSDGGTLVIGVNDAGRLAKIDGGPAGVKIDRFRNEDQMSLHLRNLVTERMGSVAMSYASPSFDDYDGGRIMVVICRPSSDAVYVNEGNRGNPNEKFYIRTGPSTTELSISEATGYINRRFMRF